MKRFHERPVRILNAAPEHIGHPTIKNDSSAILRSGAGQWHRIADKINAAMIFARPDFV
jgi:hypothetical protein